MYGWMNYPYDPLCTHVCVFNFVGLYIFKVKKQI